MQTIKEKTIYITTDGKEWSDRKQAEKWQNHLSYKNKEQNKAEFEKKYNEFKEKSFYELQADYGKFVSVPYHDWERLINRYLNGDMKEYIVNSSQVDFYNHLKEVVLLEKLLKLPIKFQILEIANQEGSVMGYKIVYNRKEFQIIFKKGNWFIKGKIPNGLTLGDIKEIFKITKCPYKYNPQTVIVYKEGNHYFNEKKQVIYKNDHFSKRVTFDEYFSLKAYQNILGE